MNDSDRLDRIAALLGQIRDKQDLQLQGQADALALLREQMALVREQQERASGIQDRAERLQASSEAFVEKSRRAIAIALPLVAIPIAAAVWWLQRLLP